ncbi:MAG: TonB-dependent receptor [Phycisphaerae bacterium]|nr:TonB-dependent receptor [Phycisphaerae bacterium]
MQHSHMRMFETAARNRRAGLCVVTAGLALGGLSLPGPAWAQPVSPAASDTATSSDSADETDDVELEDIDLLDLDVPAIPMAVTAARHAQKVSSIPYAISIITADDIRQAGARTVSDALRLVPGVDVAEMSYGYQASSPRGFHGMVARSVLVLVDGRQIYDSLFGGTVWNSWPIQLEDIERVEVIRGPGGVAWGANAINGVINIITKDPKDDFGLTVTGGGGSRGTHKEHLGYSFGDDKFRLRVSGEFEASDGWKRGGSIVRKYDDEYKIGRVNVHAVYEPTEKDTLSFWGGNSMLDGGLPLTPAAGLGVGKNPHIQASFLQTRWNHQVAEDNHWEVNAYVNDFECAIGFEMGDYRYDQFALQFGHTFKPAESHTLSWGIDGRADLLDTTNSEPYLTKRDFLSTGIIGIYVQDAWQLAPKWTLDLGARIDYEFYGGFQPSARGSLAYAITEDSMVYGAISRAFKMSPVGVRHLKTPFLNGLAQLTGHHDVDAEPAITYELGYRQKWGKLDFNANVYWHEYANLTTISPQLGPPGLISFDLANRADASTYGVELDGKYAVTDNLMLLGNYTYQMIDWRADVPYHDKELISMPKHKFMVGARWSPTDDLHLSSHLYFTDKVRAPNPLNPFIPRRVASYFRLDLRAEHEFWDDRASIAVGVRNLLDDAHYEGGTLFMNDGQVPRMVYAEMRLHFK